LNKILSLEWDWEAVIVLHFDIFLGCQGDELEEGEIAASVDSDQNTDHWGGASKKRSINVTEAQAPARPRIVFKHSRTNGLQEPVAEPDLMRDNRTARTQAGLLGSYSGDKGRLPEGQQKKVFYLNIIFYLGRDVVTILVLRCNI
jgi:hypothetical protein